MKQGNLVTVNNREGLGPCEINAIVGNTLYLTTQSGNEIEADRNEVTLYSDFEDRDQVNHLIAEEKVFRPSMLAHGVTHLAMFAFGAFFALCFVIRPEEIVDVAFNFWGLK